FGTAWRTAFYAALVLLLGVVTSEAYNLITTAETTMISRAEAIAPILKQAQKRSDALAALANLEKSEPKTARLALAKAALNDARLQSTNPAVEIATKAVETAQGAVDAEAKNIGCKKECWRKQDVADTARADLKAALALAATEQTQRIATAQSEVVAALADAVAVHAAAIAAAKAVVEANPAPPVSPTIFADKTGWADWAVDLLVACLRSVALNGAAAGLIAFGSIGLKSLAPSDELSAVRTMFEKSLPDETDRPTVAEVIGRRNGPSGKGGPSGRRTPDRPAPGPSGGMKNPVKAAVFDDIMQHLADGRTIPSQQWLADKHHNGKKTTISEWMIEWRKNGVIPAGTINGRCKATVPNKVTA
ncbi:MAG: hypothetical protein HOO99_04145, partial [Hyphomicrobiaceae bacterium]|nr:hypothetical protein [Hyphomicrobiaceae bacterium]